MTVADGDLLCFQGIRHYWRVDKVDPISLIKMNQADANTWLWTHDVTLWVEPEAPVPLTLTDRKPAELLPMPTSASAIFKRLRGKS